MTSVDIAVVGGGILGSLVAHELLAEPDRDSVMLIERELIGSGASRRSAGLHFPRGASADVREMSLLSQRYWERLLELRPDLPIHRLPMTLIASPAGAEAAASAYRLAAPRRLDQLPPLAAGLPLDSLAWQVMGCHYADVAELAQQLVGALRPRLAVREGTRVTELSTEADGVELGLATGERVQADRVVLAPGPWLTEPAWRDLIEPLGLRVKQVVAMHIDRRPEPGDGIICFHDEDAFLLPMSRRGYWLFSYTSQNWDVEPDRLNSGLSGAELDTARDCLRRMAPQLLPYCTGGRVFCDAYSPAREPIITHLDPTGRIVFAGGCNGAGYRLAPAIATRACALVRAPTRQGSPV
jgi:D-arginine dehydrogenase